MACIRGEAVFDRPVQEVFDVLADPRNEPGYNPLIVRAGTTAGSVRSGARFVQRATTLGGSGTIDIGLTGYERPRRLGFAIRMSSLDIRGEQTFVPFPAVHAGAVVVGHAVPRGVADSRADPATAGSPHRGARLAGHQAVHRRARAPRPVAEDPARPPNRTVRPRRSPRF
jgi:hypothetical protein